MSWLAPATRLTKASVSRHARQPAVKISMFLLRAWANASLSVELVPCRRARLLDWGTRNRPVGAEDAAITRPRAQECAAAGAFIEKLTGVRRHRLTFPGPAYRAGDSGIRDHRQRSAED